MSLPANIEAQLSHILAAHDSAQAILDEINEVHFAKALAMHTAYELLGEIGQAGKEAYRELRETVFAVSDSRDSKLRAWARVVGEEGKRLGPERGYLAARAIEEGHDAAEVIELASGNSVSAIRRKYWPKADDDKPKKPCPACGKLHVCKCEEGA